MKRSLLALGFTEGMAVMAAELCGAKLLSPLYGNSLYVWAAVLGVTLTALAAGYFYGGLLANRSNTEGRLKTILLIASIYLLIMPALAVYLIPYVSYLSFYPAVILSAILLLLIPILLLGAASPLFIQLQVKKPEDQGRVSGVVFAISTFGGIAGTFGCGFVLIPLLGIHVTLLCMGLILFLMTLLVLKNIRWIMFLVVLSGIISILYPYLKVKNNLYFSEGLNGIVAVQDHANGVRVLKVNEIIQTEMYLNTGRSKSDYIRLLDTLTSEQNWGSTALVLGLGGGLTANLFHEKMYRVTGVEFDERIVYAAQNFFRLSPQINTVVEDARYFINRSSETYDLILMDLFHAEQVPWHVVTLETFEKLKQTLGSNGVLLINWHGYLNSPEGKGTLSLVNTLRAAGMDVKICALSTNEAYRNLVLVAHHSGKLKNTLPYEIMIPSTEGVPVNTDSHPIIERYNASVNVGWRRSYLRYLQGA